MWIVRARIEALKTDGCHRKGESAMESKTRRESRKFRCPDENRVADLMIEWRRKEGKEVVESVHCDNPRLRDLDNWDCRWTCLDALEKAGIKEYPKETGVSCNLSRGNPG
jgi:hypothetical protein